LTKKYDYFIDENTNRMPNRLPGAGRSFLFYCEEIKSLVREKNEGRSGDVTCLSHLLHDAFLRRMMTEERDKAEALLFVLDDSDCSTRLEIFFEPLK
jgi:hypothetical protein